MTEFQLAFSTADYEENYFTGAPEPFENPPTVSTVQPGIYRVADDGALVLLVAGHPLEEQELPRPEPNRR